MNKQIVPSVNFHLWQPCNMRCKFCFATFQDMKNTILPKGHLPKRESIEVVRQIALAGFQKITFVGGEPTLCPWLMDLLVEAKSFGLNTGIVTNATSINKDKLGEWKPVLDWIGISVDSLNNDTNVAMGRTIAGSRPINSDYYFNVVRLINEFGFKLKINTVLNQYNIDEDLSEFIAYSKTKRWKVLQILPIKGENDTHIESLEISHEDFESFISRHSELVDIMVPENNDKMRGSYAMIDPAGRFFENTTGSIIYSDPILEVGLMAAYKQAHPNIKKFEKRGGIYNW